MMLEGSGFSVVDLGTDVPPERFIQAVRARAKVVAMSALLTTTMTNMKAIVDAVREAGLRHEVRIIVGGAPITARYAEEIGDDGYASDAPKAVRKVKELLGVQAEATTPSGGSNLL
jgi:5-methyltetrahydrofolate--homocysteine methyltransferase